MAKQGSPRMAITACYGGPVFSASSLASFVFIGTLTFSDMFFGLGASLTYKCLVTLPTPYQLASSHLYYVTGGFVLMSLLITLIVIAVVTKYLLNRKVAYGLIALYLSYTVFAVLTALGVLWPEK